MRRLQILLMSLLIFSSCNDTHYATGVGLMGITGLAAYPIKKPLEACLLTEQMISTNN